MSKRRFGAGAAVIIGAAILLASLVASAAAGTHFSGWSTAQKVDEIAGNSPELNTPFIDGCPMQSPDGLSLYMASNRPGGQGSLDIWVARRESADAPFGPPENLGEPINTPADELCPTPVRGGGLFFVSRKTTAESCGMGDIYFTRKDPADGWAEPKHLACAPEGPNSGLDEQGPSYVEDDGRELLYFSRSSGSVPGDIYVSERAEQGGFGPASPVGQDVYVSTRERLDQPWSTPTNLGTAVNTAANETRPSLSWDARTLYFGRAPGPEGMSDIYVSTREELAGSGG